MNSPRTPPCKSGRPKTKPLPESRKDSGLTVGPLGSTSTFPYGRRRNFWAPPPGLFPEPPTRGVPQYGWASLSPPLRVAPRPSASARFHGNFFQCPEHAPPKCFPGNLSSPVPPAPLGAY